MSLLNIIMVIGFALVLVVFTVSVIRFIRRHRDIGLAIAVISAPLGLTFGSILVASPTPWLRTFGVLIVLLGVFAAYYMVVRLFGSSEHQRFQRQVTPFLAVAGLIVLYLDYLRGDNGGSFVTNQPYVPNDIYYISYSATQALMSFISACCVPPFLYSLRNAQPLEYRIRLIAFCSAYIFAFLSGAFVIVYALALMLTGAIPSSLLNNIQMTLTGMMVVCFVLGIVPNVFFRLLLSPYRSLSQHQTQQVERSLTWLHQQVTAIVPWIRLGGYRSELRLLVEISDARRVILSHLPKAAAAPLAPAEEAAYLAQLVKQGQIIEKAGPHTPLPPNTEVRTHHLAVAQHLAQQIRQ